MTLTQYAGKITELLNESLGPDFEFPDSFDGDCEACMQLRLTAEQAAEKLDAEYRGEEAIEYTHYQAQINRPELSRSPERGPITELMLASYANWGTTPPEPVRPDIAGKAEQLRSALLAGRVVSIGYALVSPLTTTDFKSGELSPTTGSERITI